MLIEDLPQKEMNELVSFEKEVIKELVFFIDSFLKKIKTEKNKNTTQYYKEQVLFSSLIMISSRYVFGALKNKAAKDFIQEAVNRGLKMFKTLRQEEEEEE